MIRYTVLWRQEAEQELAGLWCNSLLRRDITRAADHIDDELRENAHEKGLVLPDGVKSFIAAPLTAYFHVDEADRKVFVEAIRLTQAN